MDQDMVKAAKLGPDHVAGKTFAQTDTSDRDGPALMGGEEMQTGQASWIHTHAVPRKSHMHAPRIAHTHLHSQLFLHPPAGEMGR